MKINREEAKSAKEEQKKSSGVNSSLLNATPSKLTVLNLSAAHSGAHILFSDNGNGHSHKRTIRH
jgi:hypothetical protein